MATRYTYPVGLGKKLVTSVCVGDLVQVQMYNHGPGPNGITPGALVPDANGLLPHLLIVPRTSGADQVLGEVGGTQGENATGSASPQYRVDLGLFHSPFIGEVYIDGGAVAAGAGGSLFLAYDYAYTKRPGRRIIPRPHVLSAFGCGGTRIAPIVVPVPFGATHVTVSESTAVHFQTLDGSAAGSTSFAITLNPGEYYGVGPTTQILIDNPPASSLHFSISI